MNIRSRIGISTLSLREIPLEQSIDTAYEQGFRVFELVPHLYGGPEQLDLPMRKRLRDKLGCFDMVTVHTSGAKLQDGRGANIASSDTSYRRESVEHYLEHIHLALDVGAKLSTFHVAHGDEKTSPEQVRAAHLEFARIALDQVKGIDLRMGYEYFDIELSKEIGKPQFGILFDIGHAALRSEGDLSAGILQLMREMFPSIVQFHAHGVHVSERGNKQDHQPLQANNGIDYARVLHRIKEQNFQGPIIFEIQNSTEQVNLENTIYAREEFVEIWEEY